MKNSRQYNNKFYSRETRDSPLGEQEEAEKHLQFDMVVPKPGEG
jgi:hypothetical protein